MFLEVIGMDGKRHAAYYDEMSETYYIYDDYYEVVDEGEKEADIIKGGYDSYRVV